MKRIIPTLALLLTFVAWSAHAGQVLMIVDDPARMGPGDLALKANFIDMGHTVKVVDDGACSSADATGCALVWVCDSVEPDKVGTKFRSVAVPVINCDPQLSDDFQFNDGSAANQGVSAPYIDISILAAPTNPLAAKYRGDVAAMQMDLPMNWSRPKGNFQLIAEAYPNLPVIFAYDSGAVMHNGFEAPNKRGGFFVSGQNAANLTYAAWRLLDAMVIWAAPPPPTPRISHTPNVAFYPIDVDESPNGTETAVFSIGNFGTAPLAFLPQDWQFTQGIKFNGVDAGKFHVMSQYGSTTYPLQPGEMVSMTVMFKPEMIKYDPSAQNHYEMTVSVRTNDPNDPLVQIKLTADTVPVDLSHFAAD